MSGAEGGRHRVSYSLSSTGHRVCVLTFVWFWRLEITVTAPKFARIVLTHMQNAQHHNSSDTTDPARGPPCTYTRHRKQRFRMPTLTAPQSLQSQSPASCTSHLMMGSVPRRGRLQQKHSFM
eukprot:4192901-Prymnesium_polylepis.1